MNLYRTLYAELEAEILEPLRAGRKLSLHGSEVRDAFIAALSCAVDDRAEKLLIELVSAGVLIHDALPEPTPSQLAFIGLQYRKHPGWVPGAVEHYRYRLTERQSPSS